VELSKKLPEPVSPGCPVTGRQSTTFGEARPCHSPGRDVDNSIVVRRSSSCDFSAYWDGNVLSSGRQAASGIYIYQLVVDGRRFTKKMIIMK
jgi:hypothetical protein